MDRAHQRGCFRTVFHSRLMAGLKAANVEVDRKVLAQWSSKTRQGFSALAEKAKASLCCPALGAPRFARRAELGEVRISRATHPPPRSLNGESAGAARGRERAGSGRADDDQGRDRRTDRASGLLQEGGRGAEGKFEIKKETLAEGEKVKISGFGNFVVREKNARKGRNPKTGEILLDARRVLMFKPSLV